MSMFETIYLQAEDPLSIDAHLLAEESDSLADAVKVENNFLPEEEDGIGQTVAGNEECSFQTTESETCKMRIKTEPIDQEEVAWSSVNIGSSFEDFVIKKEENITDDEELTQSCSGDSLEDQNETDQSNQSQLLLSALSQGETAGYYASEYNPGASVLSSHLKTLMKDKSNCYVRCFIGKSHRNKPMKKFKSQNKSQKSMSTADRNESKKKQRKRQELYRSRLSEERREAIKKRDNERYKKRKALGLVKTISKMNAKEKKTQRERWRKAQELYRARHRSQAEQNVENCEPSVPEDGPSNLNEIKPEPSENPTLTTKRSRRKQTFPKTCESGAMEILEISPVPKRRKRTVPVKCDSESKRKERERKQRYLDNLTDEQRELRKLKDLLRYHQKKAAGVLKSIGELSEEAQEKQREWWRLKQREFRARKKSEASEKQPKPGKPLNPEQKRRKTEKMRKYRNNLSDERKEVLKVKERERSRQRRETGHLKRINDMTAKEKKKQRELWRKSKRKHKERQQIKTEIVPEN